MPWARAYDAQVMRCERPRWPARPATGRRVRRTRRHAADRSSACRASALRSAVHRRAYKHCRAHKCRAAELFDPCASEAVQMEVKGMTNASGHSVRVGTGCRQPSFPIPKIARNTMPGARIRPRVKATQILSLPARLPRHANIAMQKRRRLKVGLVDALSRNVPARRAK